MNMNEKEGGLSEGGLNVTLTIRLLMHGKVRLVNPYIINVHEMFLFWGFHNKYSTNSKDQFIHIQDTF